MGVRVSAIKRPDVHGAIKNYAEVSMFNLHAQMDSMKIEITKNPIICKLYIFIKEIRL